MVRNPWFAAAEFAPGTTLGLLTTPVAPPPPPMPENLMVPSMAPPLAPVGNSPGFSISGTSLGGELPSNGLPTYQCGGLARDATAKSGHQNTALLPGAGAPELKP